MHGGACLHDSTSRSHVQDSVKIWELMRPKETAPEQKRALVNQVIGKVRTAGLAPSPIVNCIPPGLGQRVAHCIARAGVTQAGVCPRSVSG